MSGVINMIEIRKKDLEKQGYRLVGTHSGIKVCLWCKKAIRGEEVNMEEIRRRDLEKQGYRSISNHSSIKIINRYFSNTII